MHIYFSGIGGAGIGPLAQIAHQAGYQVSGSDQQSSSYIGYLKKHGIHDIHVGQTVEAITRLHDKKPIDWLVHSSALSPDHPEIAFCRAQNIRTTKRDELLNRIIEDKQLNLVAVAGTHGKTTTTAMVVWLFKQLGLPVSYSLGAKISFGDMGHYDPGSKYFVYEADEFDRNFLAFEPEIALITGVSWDHHEIFPTREDYQAAFNEFIEQSRHSFVWDDDADYLRLGDKAGVTVLDSNHQDIDAINLAGRYNRMDAWLAINAVKPISQAETAKYIEVMGEFPGLSRRMEKIVPNLYSDYAHTPEKIRGAMSAATEIAQAGRQKLVVIYEPLTNRRQHYMIDDYKNCFAGADKVYWIPSYLAREDPDQRVIEPSEMIKHLSDPAIARPMTRGAELKARVQQHLDAGDMVVGMAGGGGGSLDDWLRDKFGS